MLYFFDIGYLGVYIIWLNDFGSWLYMRFFDGELLLDEVGWECCFNVINKKFGIFKYDGLVLMLRFYYWEMCLEMCSYGWFYEFEYEEVMFDRMFKKDLVWYIMVVVNIFFWGDIKGVV